MQSLASYTAIALDNADAYRQLNEHEHEIRRLFEEAEKAQSIAEEADAAKSAFLSTVSHGLRTPLTSVLGTKIIRKRLEDRIFPLVDKSDSKVSQAVKQVEDNLRVVVSEGERLTKLIDDVLDLAKIEAGKLEWHMENVDVADIIDRATAATSSLFDQKGLHLEKQVASDLPSVTGDRDRLIQVVINLISNAVKFTNTGSVTCRAERRAGELVVSVIDTGLGISPTDQPKASSGSSRSATRSPTNQRGPAWACRSARRSSSTTPDGSGSRARSAPAARSRFRSRSPSSRAPCR